MSLKEKVLADLKGAMKAGEAVKRDALRLLSSAIKNEEIQKLRREGGLEDAEVVEVIGRLIKQRRDSIEQYNSGGRPELAAKEQQEIDFFQPYLPEQLSPEKVEEEVRRVSAALDEERRKNFGLVMKEAMAALKGKADGKLVKGIVEKVVQNG